MKHPRISGIKAHIAVRATRKTAKHPRICGINVLGKILGGRKTETSPHMRDKHYNKPQYYSIPAIQQHPMCLTPL